MRFASILITIVVMLLSCGSLPVSAGDFSVSRSSNMKLVRDAVRAAAIAVPGTDPAFLMAIASRESNFTPDARSEISGASGWFQFTDTTWLTAVFRHGAGHGHSAEASSIYMDTSGNPVVRNPRVRRTILLMRRDVNFSAVMTAEMLMGQKGDIEAILGRKARGIDMYMTHAMGAGGAAGFLRGVAGGRNMTVYNRMSADMEKRRGEALLVLSEGVSADGAMIEASAPGGGNISIGVQGGQGGH